MVKQVILCFVVAIAMTIAGYYLCQSEKFVWHYCALVFTTVFGAMVCTVAFWSDLKTTLDGCSEDSKKSIIGDNIACTIMAWLLPISILAIGFMK